MHAAGVVIGEKPLIEIIPLTREPKENLTVVQFEKDPTEAIGLLKMDFLGLKNLTVIYEACALIKRNHGIDLDPEKLPSMMPKSTNYSPAATPLASSNLNPVACGTLFAKSPPTPFKTSSPF